MKASEALIFPAKERLHLRVNGLRNAQKSCSLTSERNFRRMFAHFHESGMKFLYVIFEIKPQCLGTNGLLLMDSLDRAHGQKI
ncbi:hypothetical protein CEXT_770971 [Caerostris extrusa]|uniref:Uncharacterized protein n=1 Tax=Caerostris extrusa TaxID=172846 RepID=A0AAV4TAK1_CAEEX|nr:hypothetical protein CEXT_770971 [Caerostris extrusa]